MQADRRLPCDACAYDLRGLNPDGLCPECGTGVWLANAGTAWQRRRNPWTWVRTAVLTIVRPRRMLAEVAARRRPRTILVNMVVMSLQGAFPPFWLSGPPLAIFAVPVTTGLAATVLGVCFFVQRLELAEPADESERRRRNQLLGHALFPCALGMAIVPLLIIVGGIVAMSLHSYLGGPLAGGLGMAPATGVAIEVTVFTCLAVLAAGAAWSIVLALMSRWSRPARGGAEGAGGA